MEQRPPGAAQCLPEILARHVFPQGGKRRRIALARHVRDALHRGAFRPPSRRPHSQRNRLRQPGPVGPDAGRHLRGVRDLIVAVQAMRPGRIGHQPGRHVNAADRSQRKTRMVAQQRPCHHRAHRPASHHHVCQPEVRNQSGDVARQRRDRGAVALARQAVSGMVGRDQAESRQCQRPLAIEGLAGDRPSVQQQQRPSLAGFAPAWQGAARGWLAKSGGAGLAGAESGASNDGSLLAGG
ncbi:hypothetical protein AU476_23025 [Cupriavidus sp. UYMSc13B]|nr:hypothetical protein AU476_23025 [Cupriavidus sp. UYMSc13B]